MKVQLLHPPVYLNVHAMTALRPTLPLGLAYVAASLEEAGHEVSVLDGLAEAPDLVEREGRIHRLGLSPDAMADRLDPDADVIGISNAWSFSWPLVRRLAHAIKERRPDAFLVAGGEHFTGLPEFSMQEAPLDACVLGEGEEIAVELMDALADGRPLDDIEGLALRRNGDIAVHPRRARRTDVDSIPWPAWHHFDIEAYNHHDLVTGLHKGRTVPILATRGCPYSCTYCSSPRMWTTRWFPRDPDDVVSEIASYVDRYEAVNFPFHDLTAIIKKDWIVRFCNGILDRGLDVVWQFPSGTRCEVIDEEVADLLRRSGGRHLAFAPESGSEETRKLIKKKMTTEGLMSAVDASCGQGLNITLFVVIGFPHDRPEHLKDTAAMARRAAAKGVDDVAIGFFFPIPNTQLYDELRERGRVVLNDEFLLTPVFANDERLREENNYCDHLTARQLTRWKYWILLNFHAVSVVTHPGKFLMLLWDTIRGRENRKMGTFLLELKRKSGLWLRTTLGRASTES